MYYFLFLQFKRIIYVRIYISGTIVGCDKMKTYMFIGSKDLIDYYLTNELLNNKIIVVDHIKKEEYRYNDGFKGNIKRKINNSNYSFYNIDLSSKKFKEILFDLKTDYIVMEISNLYKSFDLFRLIDYLQELSIVHKYNLIYLSSLSNNQRKNMFDKTMEMLLNESKINNITIKTGNLVGYNTLGGIVDKRINQIMNKTYKLFSYDELYLLDMEDLIKIIFSKIEKDDNNYFFNFEKIDIKKIDDIIINYFHLNEYYNDNNRNDYYMSNKIKNLIKHTNSINYIEYIPIEKSIINTCEWYERTHIVNRKLDTKLKNKIDKSSKKYKLNIVKKYNQNYLSNKEIVDYIKNNLNKVE